MTEKQEAVKEKSWFDKGYRLFFIIPIIILIVSLAYLGFFFSKHGDFILRDTSLSGGTTITLNGGIDAEKLEASLKTKFPDVSIRKLTDIRTGKSLASIIETSSKLEEIKPEIENILGYNLTDENSSIEFAGPTLSQGFYKQLIKAVFISFVLMAMAVFFVFGESLFIKIISFILSLSSVRLTFPEVKLISALVLILGIAAFVYGLYIAKIKKNYLYVSLSFLILILTFIFPIYQMIFILVLALFIIYFFTSIPSIAVVFSAFSDIVMPLALINFLGIKLSAAGIAAFLMLIGYSVDTDVLLTTRALKKKEGTLNERIFGAFKTGIFMTSTALISILPVFFIISGLPDSFRQIFLILALGLFADIINTWLSNIGIIKWYCDRKGIR